MSAARPLTALRAIAVTATLPLLLTACGYGSEATKDEPKTADTANAGKKLSAAEVRIGYFPNLTHTTALVGLQEGLIEKELGGTKIKPQS
ncbi:sulfate ABC transporter substrate-binding protein, partial [Streptomyces virginiae]